MFIINVIVQTVCRAETYVENTQEQLRETRKTPMTYRIITLWKLNKVTVEKISVCDSEVGAGVPCKISIWFRESPGHKQSFRNI